jgi:hypothetical protein
MGQFTNSPMRRSGSDSGVKPAGALHRFVPLAGACAGLRIAQFPTSRMFEVQFRDNSRAVVDVEHIRVAPFENSGK